MRGERVLVVDLTGSNCGPAFRSVEVRGDWPSDWDDDRLRQECATHYAIPVEQVTVKTASPANDDATCDIPDPRPIWI